MPGRQLIGSLLAAGVALLLALAPAGALAEGPPEGTEPPPGSGYGFKLRASNGYQLIGLPLVGRGGEGRLLLVAVSHFSAVTYNAPATVTAETVERIEIEADLAALGHVSVALAPTGRQKSVRVGCEGNKRVQVEDARYSGTIEFHGEEGFTEVTATGAAVDYDLYRRMLCAELGFHTGRSYPQGASLQIQRPRDDKAGPWAAATKPHPTSRTWVIAGIDERRGEITISRRVDRFVRPGALRFGQELRTATLRPPAPFSGHATFNRDATRASRWTGNLSVDFPGRSGVALAGPGFSVDLFHPGP